VLRYSVSLPQLYIFSAGVLGAIDLVNPSSSAPLLSPLSNYNFSTYSFMSMALDPERSQLQVLVTDAWSVNWLWTLDLTQPGTAPISVIALGGTTYFLYATTLQTSIDSGNQILYGPCSLPLCALRSSSAPCQPLIVCYLCSLCAISSLVCAQLLAPRALTVCSSWTC
jgi:hypothetical protein